MRICECGNKIPWHLRNRSKCLACQPFETSKYRKKSTNEVRSKSAAKARKYYHDFKAKYGIDPVLLLRSSRRNLVLSALGNKCQFCGYGRMAGNLAFHHLSEKEHGLSIREFQFSLSKLLPELSKCVLCCHNCHGEIHNSIIADQLVLEKNAECIEALQKFVGKEWSDFGISVTQLALNLPIS